MKSRYSSSKIKGQFINFLPIKSCHRSRKPAIKTFFGEERPE
jgi:hypothetical protein